MNCSIPVFIIRRLLQEMTRESAFIAAVMLIVGNFSRCLFCIIVAKPIVVVLIHSYVRSELIPCPQQTQTSVVILLQ